MSRDTCDECKNNEKLNKAVLWCMQCEESLCDDCVKIHKNQKFLKNHNLVNINEAPKFSKPPNECPEHPNLELEFYCFDHKTLSCKECLICRHKLCEKVTVDAAASNIQQTKPFTELNDRIKIIQSTLQTMMTDRTKNIEDIESEIKEIKEKTRATKESFIKHLEFLEQQLFSDLDKAKDIHIQKINEVIKNTKTNIDSIEEKSTAFEWTKKNGSDNQIFMLIHTSQKYISDIEDRVEELTSNVVSINITPSSDKISTAQLSIGSFEVKKTLQNNAFKSKRLHQCQSLAPCNIQQDLSENVSYTTMCTSNSIDIQWYTYSTDDSIITYLVEYNGETMEKGIGIKTEQPRVKLLNLEPNTKYQIEIGAQRKNGNRFTLLQAIISTTYPKVIEEILKCTNISGDSQREAEKKEDTDPKTYCLKVTKEGHIIDSKKVKKSTMRNSEIVVKFTIEDTNQKICCLEPIKEEDIADPANVQKSKKKEVTNPKIYWLKPIKEEYIADSENVRKCLMISDISKTAESLQNQKTIIVMGASGSGKTTFIDAMFNHMIGVSYDDDHRFKIVNLTESEKIKVNNQNESQTEGVTWYTFPMLGEPQMNGIINIIDTPGFDDTRGTNYDKEIPRMIEILFSKGEGIESVDAICLVEKLSVNRLTVGQENIFKSVTEIFGKDIADNFCACLTFDDGGEAPVLKAFEKAGMSYLNKVNFRFNNSFIFSKNEDRKKHVEHVEVWRKRRTSFGEFFKQLEGRPKKSLRSTKDVLNSRSSLQLQLLSLQQNLRNQVQNISNVEQRRNIIQDCQMNIDKNKNFESVYHIRKKTKRAYKLICLNCPKCEKTCYNNYREWSKYMCEVMFWNGCCKICDCSYSDHIDEQFKYHEVFEEVKTTSNYIFQEYKRALDKKIDETDILGLEENLLRNSFKNLAELFSKIQNFIEQLNKIALTPATFSLEHYIADVITLEKYSNEPGSKERIASLQNISEVVKNTDEKNSFFNNLCEAFEISPSSPSKENCQEGTR